MTREEMIAENFRAQAEHASKCAEFERQAARYRAVSEAAIAVVQIAIDQLNAPWIALADEIRRMP